jgi:hypothetical protein
MFTWWEQSLWVLLGATHGLAYLTKGFALPWLALCTVLAILLSSPPKRWVTRLAFAAMIPLVVVAIWASVLHSKYGVLTTGTQFKANFLQWTVKAYDDPPERKYVMLSDTRAYADSYGVNDPMPPGSWPWRYQIHWRQALPKMASSQFHNLTKATKELLILVTPGGLLAFALVVVGLAKHRVEQSAQYSVGVVIAMGLVTLCLAYCLLVFDGRYLYPIIPLMMAVAVGLLLARPSALRTTAGVVTILGLAISTTYSSSPFRTLDRDFQISSYRAGELLRTHPGRTVATIGSGPYPEHGVGWEAGYKAAYFGDRWLVAATDRVPASAKTAALLEDLAKAAPDAVMIWGRPGDGAYKDIVKRVQGTRSVFATPLLDPSLGEVGTAVFFERQ